jgi:hypothetical protein
LVQILWLSSRYTKKNTLIQHARKSRVRHNVKSIGNRHNSLKIQRNCVKYSLITLRKVAIGVRNCAHAHTYGLINDKSTTSMACVGYYVHKYRACYYTSEIMEPRESMAFWLNRCTMSLRWANANSTPRVRKNRKRRF